MSQVKRITIKSSCNCGKKQLILEVDYSFNKDHLQVFLSNNFLENKSYTRIGILYIEDLNLVATGAFGSNRLNVKCKNATCEQSIANVENILKSI